jgi:hypothetical protein
MFTQPLGGQDHASKGRAIRAAGSSSGRPLAPPMPSRHNHEASRPQRVRDDDRSGHRAKPRDGGSGLAESYFERNRMYLACTSHGPRVYLGGDPGVAVLLADASAGASSTSRTEPCCPAISPRPPETSPTRSGSASGTTRRWPPAHAGANPLAASPGRCHAVYSHRQGVHRARRPGPVTRSGLTSKRRANIGRKRPPRGRPKWIKPQVRMGAPPGTRTPNPQIKSLLLCQLS